MVCFTAYHGTGEKCAIAIEKQQQFTFGALRKDHWLGKGAYFFREDKEQATLWALYKVRNNLTFRRQKPTIIKVILQLDEVHFLNLDTRDGLHYLRNFLEYLKNQENLKIDGIVSEEEDKTIADKVRSYVLSLLPDDIWLIQRTFVVDSVFDRDELLAIMGIRLHGVQICLRNNNAIKPESIKIINKQKRYKARTFENIEI
jgi:hypothetical protein